MSLTSSKSNALFSASLPKNIPNIAIFEEGKLKNSLFAFNSQLNSIYSNDIETLKNFYKEIDAENVWESIVKLVKTSGEFYTDLTKLIIPTNTKGTDRQISEGSYQRDAGAISFLSGSHFTIQSALSFDNSRQILNRSQINQTISDLSQEITQQKYSKIEFTNCSTSKNNIEIVEERNIVRSDSYHSYANTYQNTAKNVLIQAYSPKSKLLDFPIELPISLNNVGDILGTLPTLPIDAPSILGTANKTVSSVLNGALGKVGGLSSIVAGATNVFNNVNGIASIVKDPKGFLGNAGLTLANKALGSLAPGVPEVLGIVGGNLPGALGDIASAGLGSLVGGGGLGGLLGGGGLGGIFGDSPISNIGGLGLLGPNPNSVSLLSKGIIDIFASKVAQILATKELTIASHGTIYNITDRDYLIKAKSAIEAITYRDLKIEARGSILLSSRKVRIRSGALVSSKVRILKVPKQLTPFETKIPDEITFPSLEKIPVNPNSVPAAINQIGVGAFGAAAGAVKLNMEDQSIMNISATPNTTDNIDQANVSNENRNTTSPVEESIA